MATAARWGALADGVTAAAACLDVVLLVAQLVRARPLGGKTDVRIRRFNAHVRRVAEQLAQRGWRGLQVDMSVSVVGACADEMSNAIYSSARGFDWMVGVWAGGQARSGGKRVDWHGAKGMRQQKKGQDVLMRHVDDVFRC